jgi:hypothetical protein
VKRTRLFLTSIFYLIFSNVIYPQSTFQKQYGGTVIDFGSSVEQTSDSGFIICGYSRSYGAGNADVYLIKTDSRGDTLWTRTYGNTGYDDGTSVKQTFDGGYIVTGGTSLNALYLIKTKSNGDTLWTRVIEDSLGGSWGIDVVQTSDSGYVITGDGSFTSSFPHVYLVKVNSNGDILWTKIFGGPYYQDRGRAIVQASNSDLVITGFSLNFNSSGGNSRDIYVIRTNSVGDTIWTKTYDAGAEEEGYGIEQTTDGGFVLTGYTSEYPMKLFLFKIDSIGDTLWTKLFSSTQFVQGYSLQKTADNGFIIAGTIENVSVNKPYALLMKTDSIGDTLWTRTFGLQPVSSSGEEAHSVRQLNDGSYVFVGVDITMPGPDYRIYFVKTDSNGHSNCNEAALPINVSSFSVKVGNPNTTVFATHPIKPIFTTIVNKGSTLTEFCSVGISETINYRFVNIYPNPFTNEFSIAGTEVGQEIFLYNVTGKEILRLKTIEGETRLNTEKLSAGVYVLKYKFANFKLVKF